MSHTDDCPMDFEARREGKRAGLRGTPRYRNPYGDEGDSQHCEEAAEAWERGWRAGRRQRLLEEEEGSEC